MAEQIATDYQINETLQALIADLEENGFEIGVAETNELRQFLYNSAVEQGRVTSSKYVFGVRQED